MVLIAKEKRKYQRKLIENIYEKYKDPEFRKKHYEMRMHEELRYITEHMSTKRRLVKSKEMKRNIEMKKRLAEMDYQVEGLLTQQSFESKKEQKAMDLQEVLNQYSEPMKE